MINLLISNIRGISTLSYRNKNRNLYRVYNIDVLVIHEPLIMSHKITKVARLIGFNNLFSNKNSKI